VQPEGPAEEGGLVPPFTRSWRRGTWEDQMWGRRLAVLKESAAHHFMCLVLVLVPRSVTTSQKCHVSWKDGEGGDCTLGSGGLEKRHSSRPVHESGQVLVGVSDSGQCKLL